MAIKVVIPENTTNITVGGLHQWDYGQVLEIECVELGSEIMEVHFACSGMTEAIVRPCTFANGVGTVTIPDRCLEQASNITAWVYQINGTQGHTVKTITLPIVARIRPSKSQDVPTEYINKYAEALTEINEAVNALENGNITAKNANHAVNADKAATATSAASATYATSAGSATTAGSATSATRASSIDVSKTASCAITNGSGTAPDSLMHDDIYLVRFEQTNSAYSGICCWNNLCEINVSSLGIYSLGFVTGGGGRELQIRDKDGKLLDENGTLKFYRLGGF